MSWWVVYTAGGTVWVIFNAILLLLQRRSAASTIPWLLVLVFLPVIGLLAYRLIGPLKLERRKRKRSSAKRIVEQGTRGLAALHHTAAEQRQLASLPIQLGGMPPLWAESVDLYFDGASAYQAILGAVASAQDHIHVEYYIWDPDTIGTRLRDALIERARAGVKIRVLVDGAGSKKLSRPFLQPLLDAGAAVAWVNPVRLFALRRHRIDFRTHRKIVVCDGRVGFTGGMNISNLQSGELSKYFIPDETLLTSLTTAALRGVDVRVMVPKRSDSRLLDLAARSYFPSSWRHEYVSSSTSRGSSTRRRCCAMTTWPSSARRISITEAFVSISRLQRSCSGPT